VTEKTLLIATVGGAPQPIVASIKRWKPERILFVVSPETKPEVEGKIAALLAGEDYRISPGIWDALCVPSAQDFAECVKKMGELSNEVKKWLNRGEDFQVVVDFTGGTKCMTAALSLQAHRWPCIFSYVGRHRADEGRRRHSGRWQGAGCAGSEPLERPRAAGA